MKIYIVEQNFGKFLSLDLAFKGCNDVTVANAEFGQFMLEHPEVDCIVSPANAFGIMTGGFDEAISEYLGWDFQKNVQKYIQDNFWGEQVVGTSFIIDTPKKGLKLIHTPTMRVPQIIEDPCVVYNCMRSTLMCALQNNIQCIVIPIFGGLCGQVDKDMAALMMKRAYNQIKTGKSIENLYL